MMERRIIKGMILVMTISAVSCFYDSEEDLYPFSECVTTDMSLQIHILPILERNCYACHSAAVNTGNITVEGHSELIKHVNSGKLLGAIRHESGFRPMPDALPKMNECDISKIEHWIADGAPNN